MLPLLLALSWQVATLSDPLGRPVYVAEVAPEGDVAWYCEAGDAPALAALLRQALASRDELARRGQRARVLAQENYSIEAAQQRYETLCRQLLASKGRG